MSCAPKLSRSCKLSVALLCLLVLSATTWGAAVIPDALNHSVLAPPTGVQAGASFGNVVLLEGPYAVVAVESDDYGGSASGLLKIYDASTADLLFVIPNPTPRFG